MDSVNDKIKRFFRKNTTENYSKPACVSNVYGGLKKIRKLKTKIRSEDKIIRKNQEKITRDIKNLFEEKEEDFF